MPPGGHGCEGGLKVGKAAKQQGELLVHERRRDVGVGPCRQEELGERQRLGKARLAGVETEGHDQSCRRELADPRERLVAGVQPWRVRRAQRQWQVEVEALALAGALTASADWDLPPDLLRRQSQRELERAILELRRSGFDDDSIRRHVNELRQSVMASTARALKEHFILERIAEDESIADTAADYDEEIRAIATQSGESPRRVRANLAQWAISVRPQVVHFNAGTYVINSMTMNGNSTIIVDSGPVVFKIAGVGQSTPLTISRLP